MKDKQLMKFLDLYFSIGLYMLQTVAITLMTIKSKQFGLGVAAIIIAWAFFAFLIYGDKDVR